MYDLRTGVRVRILGKAFERTGNSSYLGVQVFHRGFQVGMPHDDLEVADKSSVMERVCGKGMAEIMRS